MKQLKKILTLCVVLFTLSVQAERPPLPSYDGWKKWSEAEWDVFNEQYREFVDYLLNDLNIAPTLVTEAMEVYNNSKGAKIPALFFIKPSDSYPANTVPMHLLESRPLSKGIYKHGDVVVVELSDHLDVDDLVIPLIKTLKAQGSYILTDDEGEEVVFVAKYDIRATKHGKRESDYLAYGAWLDRNEDGVVSYMVFVDGDMDPYHFSEYHKTLGTAVYKGRTVGVYRNTKEDGLFEGSIRFKVDFDNETIQGKGRIHQQTPLDGDARSIEDNPVKIKFSKTSISKGLFTGRARIDGEYLHFGVYNGKFYNYDSKTKKYQEMGGVYNIVTGDAQYLGSFGTWYIEEK